MDEFEDQDEVETLRPSLFGQILLAVGMVLLWTVGLPFVFARWLMRRRRAKKSEQLRELHTATE